MIKEYKKYLKKKILFNMSFYDSDLEGKIGEQLLIDYFNHNNIKFYDVREEPIAQWLDIDFVIPKGNYTKLDVLNEVRNGNPNKRLLRQKEIGYTIEVKLDKVTHNRYIKKNGELSNGTGNLVYEVISHNMPGCLARSYADFIFYVCVDTFDEFTSLKKSYMINLFKWRQSMVDTGTDNNQNIFIKPIKNVKEKNELVEENILNILHPVENLMQIDGAVKDFTNNVIQFFPKNLKL